MLCSAASTARLSSAAESYWENYDSPCIKKKTLQPPRKGSLGSFYQGYLITVCIRDEIPVLESQNNKHIVK